MGFSCEDSAQRDITLVQGELRAARRLESVSDLPLAGAGATGEEGLEEARVEVIRVDGHRHAEAQVRPLDPVPVETMVDAKNFSLDDAKKDRFSTKMLIETRRDAVTATRNPGAEKDYSLDLASSYSLTRNLNVTAGVRYNNNVAGRLTPMTDDRQDSQAVYLGTIFKF